MQALSPSLIPCYAAADRDAAAKVAAFLEQCGDVRVLFDEGQLQPGDLLAEKAREARAADLVLILFSHHSLPRPWQRRDWEDALVREPAEEGTRIAFARLDDCVPPKVLIPQFDLAGVPLESLRALKRWIRHRQPAWDPPELHELASALADRPGCQTAPDRALAFEFQHAYHEDFDAVFHLECAGRSLAALAGDCAAQLGLRLEGPLEENLARLRAFCSARRFLWFLDGAESSVAPDFSFGGRCSTLVAANADRAPANTPLREAQRALADPDSADWTELCRQARIGRRECDEARRIAECFELMQQWHAAAESRGDRAVLEESAREMVWILNSWGHHEEAALLERRRAYEYAQQMLLPFFAR